VEGGKNLELLRFNPPPKEEASGSMREKIIKNIPFPDGGGVPFRGGNPFLSQVGAGKEDKGRTLVKRLRDLQGKEVLLGGLPWGQFL